VGRRHSSVFTFRLNLNHPFIRMICVIWGTGNGKRETGNGTPTPNPSPICTLRLRSGQALHQMGEGFRETSSIVKDSPIHLTSPGTGGANFQFFLKVHRVDFEVGHIMFGISRARCQPKTRRQSSTNAARMVATRGLPGCRAIFEQFGLFKVIPA